MRWRHSLVQAERSTRSRAAAAALPHSGRASLAGASTASAISSLER